jgi:hypothetical protein
MFYGSFGSAGGLYELGTAVSGAEQIKDMADTIQIGANTNEELVGEALEPYRKEVVIATKFGFDIRNEKSIGVDSRPETINNKEGG